MANKSEQDAARNQAGTDDATRSQAQSVTSEPDQIRAADPARAARKGSPDAAGADADVQFFDGTISKVTADGRVVMSNHLEAGERLKREVDAEAAEQAARSASDDDTDGKKKTGKA